MSNIWEPNGGYRFLRQYVDAFTRASYSQLKVEGSLPEDGSAVLIAPNHSNTLMDALVVLRTRKNGIVYGARADIFRKPVAAKILHFLKILPMARERDGNETIRESMYAFDQIDETLSHGVPYCMFPEGRHRTERVLLPIQKGIARIAFRSARQRPTLVVPAGINYSDFFHYRGRCLLRYGKPVDVNAFLDSHSELSEAELHQLFREQLGAQIQELVNPDPLPAPSAWRWLLLPLWPVAALLSLPLWLTAELLCRKVADKAFCNSVRLLAKVILTPIFLIFWAILLFLLLPWPLATILMMLYLFSYSIFYDIIYLTFAKCESYQR